MWQELTLIGHLGGDPEMRYMQNGDAVTNFSLAVNKNYTDRNGEKITETAWFRITAWRKLGENCNQYLSKGRKVFVKGVLDFDKETGSPKTFQRSDGTMGASFNVTANNVLFLSGRDETGESFSKPVVENDELDELPF